MPPLQGVRETQRRAAMAKGTQGGSRSPIVIVMLLVAAVALALWFGRDLVSPGEPPASGTESAEQEDTGATPSDSAASEDASVDESGSLAEQVAGKIVERLEQGSGRETPTGGESVSAPAESAEPTTATPSASTADAAPEDQVQAGAATGSQVTVGDTPEDEIQASGETETAMTGAGQETESVAEGQVAADATMLPAEDTEDGAGTVAMATDEDDSATTSTADSSLASVDPAIDAAPEDQVRAGAATGSQGTVGDAPEDEIQASGETGTAMTGAGQETESVTGGQPAADATTLLAEDTEDGAGTLTQATDAGDSATMSTADSSLAPADPAADAAPEDQVQAGAATGSQVTVGDALEEEVQASDETAMTGAGQETESVAEGQVAADAPTLPSEDTEEGAGAVAMPTDEDDSATASVDSAADSASDDQMQAGAETADSTIAAAPEDETPPPGVDTAPSSSSGVVASEDTAQPGSGGATDSAGALAPSGEGQTSDSSTPPSPDQIRSADAGGQQVETTDPSTAVSRDARSEEEQLQIAEEVATRVADAISDLRPSPDPGTVAIAAAEVAEELGLDVATLARAVAQAVVEEQAESFVEQIAEADPQPLEVDDADHFVSPDQMISLLPDASFEITSREEILSDPELGPDTPITVVREVEEIRIASPEKLIASAGGDLDQEIRVLEDDELRVKTLDELLAELMESPAETITIVSDVQYFEVTTPSEFARQSQVDDDEPLKIIKDRYTLEAASVAELLRQELDLPSDAIFYLRTVRPEDAQGIWGIVQEGLSGNFARGMAIRYGQSINTYKIEIPRYADEILPDNSSSFLGKLIHEKTLESYVYNFRHHRIGRNPDRIYPGQEIVIINFRPEELISIFKHFVEQRTASG